MIPLHTVEDVKSAEQNAVEAGVTESELMIRAATAMFHEITEHYEDIGHAVILAGPGKNGGDGVVLATLLDGAGWSVDVWGWNRDDNAEVPVETESLEQIIWVTGVQQLKESLESADLVLDAVFGAGSRLELPEDVIEAFGIVRDQQESGYLPVWAVDLPSGVSADTGEASEDVLSADVTLTIGLPKVGLYQQPASGICGEIRLVDIGLDSAIEPKSASACLLTSDLARRALPDRRTGIHKRTAGTLLIIGGSPNYYGAPRLTGESAMRGGAGLVMIAAPSSIIAPIATAVPELTFLPLPVSEHASAAARMAEIVGKHIDEHDALVIGPGLGTETPVPEFLGQLLGFGQPGRSGIGFGSFTDPDPVDPFTGRAVIDADGLNWLSGVEEWWKVLSGAELVLTPHAGELARLLDVEREVIEADPWKHASDAAKKFGQTVVLKHGHTVVASPEGPVYVAEYAPVGLATAGTGDVLAGLIGSMLAQGLSASEAAIAGVAIGSEAALILQEWAGQTGYLASDLIAAIPEAREFVRTSQPLISVRNQS